MPMAAVSREEVPFGEAGVSSNAEKEESERADAEVRHLSDRELEEKLQRLQGMVTTGIRLRDGGRKLQATIDAISREQGRRQARGGMARATGGDGCERIVRSRCAESSDTMKASHRHRMDQVGRKHGSGFPSDPDRLSKADFQFSFGMDEKVEVDISSLETTRSRSKPNTSIENEGKLSKEEHSCKPSSLPTNSFHEEMDVDTSSNVEKISPVEASNNNGHNGMCEAAPTPSRKRKGADPANFPMRLRSRKEEVVLLDGDTPHPDSVEETSNNWDAKKLYYPSREHPNSVEISSGDIRCLQPESLLSSPIMNFYIMYLQGPMLSIIRPKGDYHIFNTYFFSKLEAMTSKEDKTSYFLKLRRWWKGIDIFEKAYVLLPVHAETHWSLVIICMPAKEDQTGPIILHLDSLKFHSSRLIFNVISRFLKEEWTYLNENVSSAECPLQETVWKNFPRKIEKKAIEVPQQENDYDCGLFVLYYMQRFIQEAPERLQKKDLSMFGKRWFRPEEPSQLRGEIRRLLQKCREPKTYATELFVEAEPKNDVTEPMSSEHLQETVDTATAKDHALIEVENELAGVTDASRTD